MTDEGRHAAKRDRSGRAAPTARRATIQDVAAEAGVSVSAVSKVLRDAYGVSAEMRAKVEAAIDHLDYRPNAGARAMRGKSFTIGVMMVEMTSPFQPEVAHGITAELEDTPYQAIFVAAGASPRLSGTAERQRRAVEALLDRQVDGVALIAPWMESSWIEDLGRTIPLVTVALHGSPETFDTVVDDEHEGARLAVDHLVELGHRRIVHTGMPPSLASAPYALSHSARQQGYEQAMRRHGLEPDVIETWYSEEGGYKAAVEAFNRHKPPTAIFAGADVAALGVLRAAEERGLRIPGDITVVGYDNIAVSGIDRVALTTVDQSGAKTGAATARLLLERLAGRTQAVRHVIAPQLIVRHTSGPLPAYQSSARPTDSSTTKA